MNYILEALKETWGFSLGLLMGFFVARLLRKGKKKTAAFTAIVFTMCCLSYVGWRFYVAMSLWSGR